MARKTPGTGIPRSKKTTPIPEASAVQPAAAEVVPEVRRNVTPITVVAKKANVDAPVNPVNLDEEIRHRAYELYLQRNGDAGDPAGDWLIAEREVRARHAGQNPSALAAGQGRN